MSNLASKVLTLLFLASLAWGGVFALLAFWFFGASIITAWTIALSVLGGMLFCILLMAWGIYQSIDPSELQADEGNEFLEAVLLGSPSF
jgi:hypothetical protein